MSINTGSVAGYLTGWALLLAVAAHTHLTCWAGLTTVATVIAIRAYVHAVVTAARHTRRTARTPWA